MKKILRIGIIVFILMLAFIFWWRYYFVFGEGVKAGNLNFFVKKGVIFKTYEGRLIQDGFKTASPGALQSNEFEFSVADESVAAVLEANSGKIVELRYKEYNHSLFWRGMSNYVVVEVVKAEEQPHQNKLPFQ
jgi:hypothetical protein